MNLNHMQQLVYRVIQNNPGVQNDDAKLVAAVWRDSGWDNDKTLEYNIARMPRSESITRRRRELFNMGLISYSDNAHKRRMEAMENEQNNAAFQQHFGRNVRDELNNREVPEAISWLND